MSEMLPHHKRVLAALAATTHPYGEYCAHFKTICDEAEMANRSEVRRITRHLARKGLAEYHRGLWTDEGEMAGSGYCITIAGLSALFASPAPTTTNTSRSGQ